MLYRIAEVAVEIEPKYEYSRSILEPYRCKGTDYDARIFASDRMIASILKKNPELTAAQAEQICFTKAFGRAIIHFGGIIFHASAIAFEGRAYLFSAASGIGKSTHTALWQKKFGDKVKLINDDAPIIRMRDGIPTVYGGPFSGGSGKSADISVPLGAVFFIKRGKENSVNRISPSETAIKLVDNTLKYEGEKYMSILLAAVDRLVRCADFFELVCTPDERAVDCAYGAVKGMAV